MSFNHTSTTKTKAEALENLVETDLPDCVRQFIRLAVGNLKDDGRAIYVHAHGHLHNGSDYNTSIVNIEVRPTSQLA